MACTGNDGTVLHDRDAVGVLDGGNSLGNDDPGDPGIIPVQRIIQFCFGDQVQCTGRVIQNEDLSLFQERTRDGDTL